jgi:hypothetical protein
MKLEEFLEKDYHLKVSYLNAHFSRMWTRFNFFLTIQSALLGLSFHQGGAPYAGYLAGAGLVLALAWYLFAATDNYLVEVYRRQVAHVFHLLKPSLLSGFKDRGLDELPEAYAYAGRTGSKAFDPKQETVDQIPTSVWQFRNSKVSVTELGVLFSFLFFLFWLVRLWLWWTGQPA